MAEENIITQESAEKTFWQKFKELMEWKEKMHAYTEPETRWQKVLYFMEFGIIPLWIKHCAFVALMIVIFTFDHYLFK